MIGILDEIGEFNPGIKECEECGGDLGLCLIENHGQGGWFKSLECEERGKRFNIMPLKSIEEIKVFRNKMNRKISTLKKANLKN